MKKRYVIKKLDTGAYFYGHYRDRQWTNEIKEAKIYPYRGEAVKALADDFFEVMSYYQIDKIYFKTSL